MKYAQDTQEGQIFRRSRRKWWHYCQMVVDLLALLKHLLDTATWDGKGTGDKTKPPLWQRGWGHGTLSKHNYRRKLLESTTLGMGAGSRDQIPDSGDGDRDKDRWPNLWKLNKHWLGWETRQGDRMVQRFPCGAHLTNLPHSHTQNQID